MLAEHQGKIFVAATTTAIMIGAFLALSANSEPTRGLTLAPTAALPENTSVPAPAASMVQTAAVAGMPRLTRKEFRRRVAQTVAAPHIPLIMGIRH